MRGQCGVTSQETTRPPALTRVLGLEPQEGTGPSPCDPYAERRNTQGRKASSLCHLYFTCCRSPPRSPVRQFCHPVTIALFPIDKALRSTIGVPQSLSAPASAFSLRKRLGSLRGRLHPNQTAWSSLRTGCIPLILSSKVKGL